MLVSHARRLGRDLGVNGVWGNLGAASASGVTALLTASFGWRAGLHRAGPRLPRGRRRLLALVPREGEGPGPGGPARKPVPVARP